MGNISNFEQNITNLSLEILSNLLKIIPKQIIELGGKSNKIIKINVLLVDLEKQRWATGGYMSLMK